MSISAHAISAQHVELGEWAKRSLPADARIGVNDTGAIAYFSGHQVFDIVGLTTTGEARYWSAGAGSRFEHYERLPRAVLPTVFIVYPPWFALPALFGPCLTERTVNATILGGATMVACQADYSRLGSGERPSLLEFWPLVAARHARRRGSGERSRACLRAAARGTSRRRPARAMACVLDGARLHRSRESFRLDLAPGGRLVTRLGAERPLTVSLRVAGRPIDSWTVERPDFEDHVLTLPPDLPSRPRGGGDQRRRAAPSAPYTIGLTTRRNKLRAGSAELCYTASMRHRLLGSTGISVSELGLGTWGLSGDGYSPLPEAEQDSVIERALALGVTLFDTADSYGKGAMETRLGERLAAHPEAVIVTKLGTDREAVAAHASRFKPEFIRESFERSRERLKRDVIDVVLLHNPSETHAASAAKPLASCRS